MSRAPAAFFARLIRRRLVAEPWPCSLPLNGDFNLFVDDGTGYIVYNSDENGALCGACHIPPCDCGFQMSVEKLAPDFKSSALENSGFIGAPTVEAPAMFKRAFLSLAPPTLSALSASSLARPYRRCLLRL